ncbi:MAG: lipid-A-disaccharide synthase, partial [Myxococcota bacterium]|nr:lipid-A-disaccharide synthase [Myxococcota bacterium]
MNTVEPRILICAGEESGDLLAAELLRELGPVDAVGIGGDALAAAGVELRVHARELAVVGLAEVVQGLPRYLSALREVRRLLDRGDIDLVLLVDFPDFNLRVASHATAAGIPVVYYVSPQVWAWRRGRLRSMARRVDRMLTLLPFEPPLYSAEGVKVTHVGHPLVDRVAPHRRPAEPPGPVVALLPGSRTGEVRSHWVPFLETARRVLEAAPDTRFVTVRASTIDPALLPVPDDLPLEVVDGPAAPVLARARCALVASGTATLEAALCGTPHAVAYRVNPLTYALGRLLVRGVDHIALSNLVAADRGNPPVAPEFLQRLDARAMAAPLLTWLGHDEAWGETRARLDRLGEAMGPPGAASRAAAAVRETLGASPPPIRPPGPRELWLLLGLAVLLVAVRGALGLIRPPHPDEAYFWRWSLDLAWGYFDQPPMVAWLIAASRSVLGDSVAAIRLPAAVCSAAALALVYLTAREHLPPRRAALAAGLLLATPLAALGGLVTTPDAPLSLAWAAFLYAATRALAPRGGLPPPADRWIAPWLWLGAAVGLGLLSKLTMAAAPVCLGVFLALRGRHPPWKGALAG